MQSRLIFLLGILISTVSVFADVKFTKQPKQMDEFSASSGKITIDLEWKDDDSSDDFNIKKVDTITVSLCTGDSDEQDCFTKLGTIKSGETKYSASIDADATINGYYFFQFYSEYKAGETIQYSNRFQLKGMKGSTATIASLTIPVTATGEAPAGQTSDSPEHAEDLSKLSTVPYTLQTGRTRLAPMQMQPGTKITAKTWSRRFKKSKVESTYASLKKSPNVMTTLTPDWSYSPASKINEATPAEYPSVYYPASSRVSKATLSAASKRKRWFD